MVFTRGGKCCRHFRGGAPQRDDDESNKGGTHSKSSGGILNRPDKYFAHQRHKNGHHRKRHERETDRPRGFMFLRCAREEFTMCIERKPKTEAICQQK